MAQVPQWSPLVESMHDTARGGVFAPCGVGHTFWTSVYKCAKRCRVCWCWRWPGVTENDMLHCIVCLSLASREGKADAESDRAGSCTRRLYAESLGLGDKHRAAHEESCSSAQPHWGKIMCVRVRGIRPTGQYGFLVTGIDSSGYSMNNDECELRQCLTTP